MRFVREFAPDVVHIRLSEGRGWTDDPALYFRVILSDDASRKPRLGEVAKRVRETFRERLRLNELEPFSYFRFRSQSEQAKRRSPEWD